MCMYMTYIYTYIHTIGTKQGRTTGSEIVFGKACRDAANGCSQVRRRGTFAIFIFYFFITMYCLSSSKLQVDR